MLYYITIYSLTSGSLGPEAWPGASTRRTESHKSYEAVEDRREQSRRQPWSLGFKKRFPEEPKGPKPRRPKP